ncbi:MAG: histidine--tRNA ligase, partial [Clostridiales bacterium]|nr:histidine--tRNA ligase [Clostridiales bacterium]
LRKQGVSAESDICERSLKAQMKYADKIGAEYVIVLGSDEIKNETVKIKKMSDGSETVCSIQDIAEAVR